MPKMVKPNHRQMDVPKDQVAAFEKAGFTLVDPSKKVEEKPKDTGLTEAEINKELAAVEKITREKAKAEKLNEKDTEAAVAAALEAAKAELDAK